MSFETEHTIIRAGYLQIFAAVRFLSLILSLMYLLHGRLIVGVYSLQWITTALCVNLCSDFGLVFLGVIALHKFV